MLREDGPGVACDYLHGQNVKERVADTKTMDDIDNDTRSQLHYPFTVEASKTSESTKAVRSLLHHIALVFYGLYIKQLYDIGITGKLWRILVLRLAYSSMMS